MDLLCYLCLSLPYVHFCSLQPCGHLLGKGLPLGSRVCDVFWCFLSLSHKISVLGQEWCLIVSIPDICLLHYFGRNGH